MSEEKEYEKLKEACKNLLDDVNNRYPDKDRTEWKCPFFQRIANLIRYETE